MPNLSRSQAWEQVLSVPGSKVSGITSDAANIFAGTDDGVYLSSDNGANWIPRSNGLTPKIVFATTVCSNGTLLASNASGIFRSTDNGNSWAAATGFTENVHIDCIVWDRARNFYAGDVAEGIFFSSDDGQSWQKRNAGLPNLSVWALAVAINGEVYAGINKYIARSADQGQHWDTVMALTQYDKVLALASDSGQNLFAGTSLGRFLRHDHAGTTWDDIIPGPISITFSTLALFSDTVYAGCSDHGVDFSYDDGNHWFLLNDGIPDSSTHVLGMTVRPSGYVFIGTQDGRVFRHEPPAPSSVSVSYSSNEGLTFLPVTMGENGSVRFFLAEPGRLRIVLYDLTGRKVVDMDEHQLLAGEHSIAIDSRELPSGLYFAVVKTENGDYSTRMAIMH